MPGSADRKVLSWELLQRWVSFLSCQLWGTEWLHRLPDGDSPLGYRGHCTTTSQGVTPGRRIKTVL